MERNQYLSENGAPDAFWTSGSVVSIGDRGVWVPNGLDGEEVWAGAQALMREHPMYEFDRYSAINFAVTILEAVNALRQSPSA